MRRLTLSLGIVVWCFASGCFGSRLTSGHARPHQDPSVPYLAVSDGEGRRARVQPVKHWGIPSFGKDSTARFVVLVGERASVDRLVHDNRPERRLSGASSLPFLNTRAFMQKEWHVIDAETLHTLTPVCWLVGLDPLVFAYSDQSPSVPHRGAEVRLVSDVDLNVPIYAIAEFVVAIRTDDDWNQLLANPDKYRTLHLYEDPLTLGAVFTRYTGQSESQLRDLLVVD